MKRKLNEDGVPEANAKALSQKESSSFSTFGLDPRLLQALSQDGFSTPTLVQAEVIPLALEGKDILARSKTGSGKTIAYLLPVLQSILRRKADDSAVQRGTSAVILVPTRELAQQVSQVVAGLCAYCTKAIQSVNLTQKVSDAVQRSQLAESPDIIIATPARMVQNLNHPEMMLRELAHLIIDEADLVLSYGYETDIQLLAKAIPSGVQMMLLSATLSTDLDTLKGLFCRDPVLLELDDKDDESSRMSQYVVKCAEDEKFLLTYVIFKLKLIKGKCIIFVSDVDRCYRLKLFLEQFGIRSCVLNSELPVNSRIHAVQEFNKNVYEIIIAADEQEVLGNRAKKIAPKRGSGEETPGNAANDDDPASISHAPTKSDPIEEDKLSNQGVEGDIQAGESMQKRRKGAKKAKEYGISRGIDFKNVACVLNFDLPTSSKSYTHRIGRTARAGQSGTALSFVIPAELYHKHISTTIPSAAHDEAVLAHIHQQQRSKNRRSGGGDGGSVDKDVLQPYHFDMTQVNAFRYRMTDALRAVTRLAVREARTREIGRELLNSEKLKRYFEENPAELRHLQRHDAELRTVRVQPHLKHVPEYLMPRGVKMGVEVGAGAGAGVGEEGAAGAGSGIGKGGHEIGFVPLRKITDNRIRKARVLRRDGLKGRRGTSGKNSGKNSNNNPLKSFKVAREG